MYEKNIDKLVILTDNEIIYDKLYVQFVKK